MSQLMGLRYDLPEIQTIAESLSSASGASSVPPMPQAVSSPDGGNERRSGAEQEALLSQGRVLPQGQPVAIPLSDRQAY